jgi:hypothetical protein
VAAIVGRVTQQSALDSRGQVPVGKFRGAARGGNVQFARAANVKSDLKKVLLT